MADQIWTVLVILVVIWFMILIPMIVLIDGPRTSKRQQNQLPKAKKRTEKHEERTRPAPEPQEPKEAPPQAQQQVSIESDLQRAARSIGVDVTSLRKWVEEQKGRTAEERSKKVMYRILSDLERPDDKRKEGRPDTR